MDTVGLSADDVRTDDVELTTEKYIVADNVELREDKQSMMR